MDDVHALRNRVGADLVHLVMGESDVGGKADIDVWPNELLPGT